MSDPAGITISEAARVLGIGERRLRRLLARPEYAARTLTVARLTQTGTRQAVAIPAALLEELRQRLEIEKNAADADAASDSDKRGHSEEEGQRRGGGTLTRTETMLSQLVARQERDIEFLKAELAKATETIQQQAATIGTLTANAANPAATQPPTETGSQASPEPRTDVPLSEGAHSAQEPAAVPKSWWVKFWDAILLRD